MDCTCFGAASQRVDLHSKNFLKMLNLETSLLLLKTQTFIVVYNVAVYISLIALILPNLYHFWLMGRRETTHYSNRRTQHTITVDHPHISAVVNRFMPSCACDNKLYKFIKIQPSIKLFIDVSATAAAFFGTTVRQVTGHFGPQTLRTYTWDTTARSAHAHLILHRHGAKHCFRSMSYNKLYSTRYFTMLWIFRRPSIFYGLACCRFPVDFWFIVRQIDDKSKRVEFQPIGFAHVQQNKVRYNKTTADGRRRLRLLFTTERNVTLYKLTEKYFVAWVRIIQPYNKIYSFTALLLLSAVATDSTVFVGVFFSLWAHNS